MHLQSKSLATFIFLSVVWKTESLQCLSCSSALDAKECNKTVTCSEEQACYKKRKFTDQVQFELGCVNKESCGKDATFQNATADEYTNSGHKQYCYECCLTQNCNRDLCDPPYQCDDLESVDCAVLNSTINICKNTDQAIRICQNYCGLCRVDGMWSFWSEWSKCDVTCENGTQTRTRSCTNPSPQNDGLICSGEGNEIQSCQQKLCPVHGGWSQWTSWETCSVTCGIGMQRRDRSCSNPYPSLNGNHCSGDSRDDIICMPGSCSVNGGWSQWTAWGSCSVRCGIGIQRRYRSCTNPYPKSNGNYCFGDSRDDRICMSRSCSDGGWSGWGLWGSCSDSCGGGIQSRIRTCSSPRPSLLGKYCDGQSNEITTCNKIPCPDKKVAFTAYGLLQGDPVIFPNILLNYGGGYSSYTGKFTCQVPGIYYFSSTLTKHYNSYTDYIRCLLQINSVSKLSAQEDPYVHDNDRSRYSLKLSGSFHLSRGNAVQIVCDEGRHVLENSNLCSYTGVLVIPDN